MKVSVIMPAYNAEKYIGKAIESILNQTFQDFELIIIDDGSTDNTANIILSYHDERIRNIRNEQNLKLPKTLNKGIELAKGEYIARMDSDDISLPNRLERQVDFMDNRPQISICGTWVDTFGWKEETWGHPLKSSYIHAQMLFECCLFHPSVLFRKQDFINNNLWYDSNYDYAEDYELWSRAIQKLQFANLDVVLLKYRLHDQQSRSTVKNDIIKKLQEQIRGNQLKNLGVKYSAAELALHRMLAINDYEDNLAFLEKTYNWLSKLYLSNKSNKIYHTTVFREVLFKRIWYPVFQFLLNKYRFNFRFWGQVLLSTIFLKLFIKTFYKTHYDLLRNKISK